MVTDDANCERGQAAPPSWDRPLDSAVGESRVDETKGSRPRLLDLFCGAGGAAMGYHRAGFDVVGVDIAPQPNYPFEFHQLDALAFAKIEPRGKPWRTRRWQVVHASPPCQAYTDMQAVARNADAHPDLIGPTRELLQASGLPFVIENVPGARRHLHDPLTLCGSMFGLGILRSGVYKQLRRHRLFETNWATGLLPQCRHERGKSVGIYGDHLRFGRRSSDGELSGPAALSLGSEAMDVDWMNWAELKEAIPPAYTEFIGAQLLEHLRRREAA